MRTSMKHRLFAALISVLLLISFCGPTLAEDIAAEGTVTEGTGTEVPSPGVGDEDCTHPEELREEVLFLCGLTSAGIQLTVAALRKAGLYIPYKASLTPTNKDWTVRQLFSEIYQEHQAMHSRQERVHTEE